MATATRAIGMGTITVIMDRTGATVTSTATTAAAITGVDTTVADIMATIGIVDLYGPAQFGQGNSNFGQAGFTSQKVRQDMLYLRER